MAEAIAWDLDGWDDAIAEIKRVTGRPGFRVIRDFEHVFKRLADDVEGKVHVITGSLKASGKRETSYDDALSQWRASIQYGGELVRAPHPGPPHDPVSYAIYERNKGGEHDFYRDVPLFYDDFERIIEDWLTPRSRRRRVR